MGLLQIVGILACCVGVYVSQAIFFPGTALIIERGIGWEQAKDVCVARIWPNWGPWTLYAGRGPRRASGALLCGIGVIVTAPLAVLALAYAYEASGSLPRRPERDRRRSGLSGWVSALHPAQETNSLQAYGEARREGVDEARRAR